MPALMPTDHYGTITWLGRVPHRDAAPIVTERLDDVMLRLDGIEGEVHGGLTRPSCSRVTSQHPKGTEIRNSRQLSLLCASELDVIARELGIDTLDPAWLGASMVIDGLPDFSHLPPSSRLQAESGATIVVDMQNRPCQFPAMTIDAEHPGRGKAFKSASKGRRGVVGWVERPGPLKIGHQLRLHVPDQRAWRPGLI